MTKPSKVANAAVSAPAGLRRSTLSTDLAAAVVQMISDQALATGQAIPALRPLAQQFGVAVPTMREALRRLEGLGILEFRHGSGIYVGPNSNRRVLANALAPQPTRQQLADLLQARLVIEPGIAALAAGARTAESQAALADALALAQRYLADNDPRLVEANLGIHRAIAAATGNAVLAETLDSLAEVHADEQAEILVLHGNPEKDYTEHADIVGYLVAGDAEAARLAMHRHLAGVLAVVDPQQEADRNPRDHTATSHRGT
ncbi:FadR/GntR family transcriptional regulator [Nakamurella lactea]|jgi:GntR family transcriptional repressor for pyruvate dehydrogenase complex|uniref:FadR/GntR family transcriptional regulator n=1 Tax=Nakamurella lactea TaxID=459515 RepID=UPI00041CD46A|nr:FCD domain-containing protein [Nakamurella lactea]